MVASSFLIIRSNVFWFECAFVQNSRILGGGGCRRWKTLLNASISSNKVTWMSLKMSASCESASCFSDSDLQMSFSLYHWTQSVTWTSWRSGWEEGRCLPAPCSIAFQALRPMVCLSVATMLPLFALCLMAVTRTVVSSSPGSLVGLGCPGLKEDQHTGSC